MLTTFKDTINTPIYAQTGDREIPLGTLLDFIINPNSGRIEAFWVDSYLEGQKILLPESILSWNQESIKIQDDNDIIAPEKLIKFKKIFEIEVQIIGAPVFEKSGNKKIGKVSNFAFETKFPQILNIAVKKYFFSFYSRIIPLLKISKITEKGIFILNDIEFEKINTRIKNSIIVPKDSPILPVDFEEPKN